HFCNRLIQQDERTCRMNGRKSICPTFNLLVVPPSPNIRVLRNAMEVAMWKTVVAGATALAIAGGSWAYAQHLGADFGGGQRWRPSAEAISAFTDARIAALKAGLKLTADQEKNWPAFEQALRNGAKVRQERFAARASADTPSDPIERLRTHADRIVQAGTALKQIADTAAPPLLSPGGAPKHPFPAS